MRAIFFTSSRVSGEKIIMSSILLRNSGEKVFSTSFIIVLFKSPIAAPSGMKPSGLVNFLNSSLPRLLVITIIVSLKYTLLPLPSVSHPSSKTCRKRLST